MTGSAGAAPLSFTGSPTLSSTFAVFAQLAFSTAWQSRCDHVLKCLLLACVGKHAASCLPTVGARILT